MSTVSILKTSQESVLNDYNKLMVLADSEVLSKSQTTVLKLNLSWTLFYPACSTPPWQLEGVLKTLNNQGYQDVVAVENQTVVTHPWKGAYLNKWLPILKNYGVEFKPLTNVEWDVYSPKSEMLALDEIFSEILVPKMFTDTNVVHFPTVKTHGHTTTTGAMKNAFGGLIPKYRHHAHKKIHEILVDLLTIQKEIHSGIFAVMDGCICGNGAGPRTMEPYPGNVILAGHDQVAVDAVAAKIMGFDPLKIDYIKLAHDRGLGIGDLDQIDVVGLEKKEFSRLNFCFHTKKSPVITWDQRLRKKTMGINPVHQFLFNSPVFKTFIFASEFYHDHIWYPLSGKGKINQFKKTQWGELFDKYEYGPYPEYTEVTEWDPY